MGAADVIPGVSGGTIAFLMGIYQELLDSIKSVNGEAFKLLLKGKIADFWKHINGNFLASLFVGILVSGVGSGAEGPLVIILIPRAFFKLFLIVLVTRVASMTHTVAAVRHRAWQTQDQIQEGKMELFCSSAATCVLYPGVWESVGRGLWVAPCPPLTLHYLLGVCPLGCCKPIGAFPEKGFLDMGFTTRDDLA